MQHAHLVIHSDGAARGNPGPAGAGAVLKTADGERVGEVAQYLGERTNNQAEYAALKLALFEAMKLGARRVAIKADSELMIKQLNGEYRVKNEGIKPLYAEIMSLLGKLDGWTAEHVRREFNKEADQLANEAIDNHFGS